MYLHSRHQFSSISCPSHTASNIQIHRSSSVQNEQSIVLCRMNHSEGMKLVHIAVNSHILSCAAVVPFCHLRRQRVQVLRDGMVILSFDDLCASNEQRKDGVLLSPGKTVELFEDGYISRSRTDQIFGDTMMRTHSPSLYHPICDDMRPPLYHQPP